MADEAPPPEPAPAPDVTTLKDFGDLDKVFDSVFPATARTTESSAEPKPPPAEPQPSQNGVDPGSVEDAVPPEKPQPSAPTPAPTAAADDLLPSELFGEKPKEAEVPKEVDVPQGITKPKDIQTWKDLRHRLDAAEAELPKFKAEAEKWRSQYETVQPDALKAKLDETERTNKELSERIAVVDLQLHPEFQRQFIQPRSTLVQSAAELVKDADIDPQEFEAALRLTGKARIDALDEIVEGVGSPSLKAQLGAKLNELSDLDRRRSGALADAQGNWQRLQEHDKAQRYETIQQEQKQMGALVDELDKQLGEQHKIVFLKKLEGNEAWNKAFDEEDKLARDIVTISKDPRQLVGAVRLGVTAPRMYNTIIALRDRLTKALAENAELKGADPSLGGRRETLSGGKETEQPAGVSFAEAVARSSGLR